MPSLQNAIVAFPRNIYYINLNFNERRTVIKPFRVIAFCTSVITSYIFPPCYYIFFPTIY